MEVTGTASGVASTNGAGWKAKATPPKERVRESIANATSQALMPLRSLAMRAQAILPLFPRVTFTLSDQRLDVLAEVPGVEESDVAVEGEERKRRLTPGAPSHRDPMRRMNPATHARETFLLVVMEHESAWPSHVQGGPGCVAALRQAPDESRGELLRRAYERVRSIERVGGAIESAVLSCSDDPSLDALEGRVPLARALLSTMVREGKGRLELVARSGAPHRTRQSVVALAGALTEALAGTSASVSARFMETSPVASLARCGRRGSWSVDEQPPAL